MKIKAEIENCRKCATITHTKSYNGGVHTMECPKCGHTWKFIPYGGE